MFVGFGGTVVYADIITSIAGRGNKSGNFSGDGNPVADGQTYFKSPRAIAKDSLGNIYIADTDNQRIRKINTSGIISTIAGTGAAGYNGDGIAATSAHLNTPFGVAVDSTGNILIAEWYGHRIRKVNNSGIISTIAGTGTAGFSGDGELATAAQLNRPSNIAIDSSGNIYIADSYNHSVRKISITTGIISTVAGTGVLGYSGDGEPATSATFNYIDGIGFDSADNLYIADTKNQRIRKVNTAGIVTTIAGTGIANYNGDGIAATSAQLNAPYNVGFDSVGNLYIADTYNHRFRKVDTSGIISTIAGNGTAGFSGDGGDATAARVYTPAGVLQDNVGNILIVETDSNTVRKVAPYVRIIRLDSGNLFLGNIPAGSTATQTFTISNTGNSTLTVSSITYPTGFSGNWSGTIAAGASQNVTVTFAPTAAKPYGGIVTVNSDKTDGNNAFSISGNDISQQTGIITTVAGNCIAGYSGDGGPATASLLNYPRGIAKDSIGNLYIADASNHRIRKIDKSGNISTIAGTGTGGFSGDGGLATSAQLNSPFGASVDSSGNIYIADMSNHRVRKINSSGIISTVAGTGTAGYSGDGWLATSAKLYNPDNVAFDSVGNIYIADAYNHCVRKINASGIISTVAGTGIAGFSGDGGPATSAQFNGVDSVAVDNAGNLYIADTGNNRIRKVNTAGIVSTIAGTGVGRYNGDGIPATSANLYAPFRINFDSAGNLYIADTFNSRVRKVDTSGIITTFAGNGIGGCPNSGVDATSVKMNNPAETLQDNDGNILIVENGIYCYCVRKVTPYSRIIGLSGNLAFGNVNVNTTKQLTLTISNTGNAPMTVSSISYPSGFSGNWSGTIAAGSSQNVTVKFAPTAAQNYSGTLTVGSDKTSGTDTLSISGAGIIPPANDDFVNAVQLSGNTGQITGNNRNAGKETGEPDHASKTGNNSVWWTWIPSQSGTAIFDTCGSDFDTVIAVYIGASVGTLTKLADNDDSSDCGNKNSKVSVNIQADIRYYIAVAGYEGNSGNIVLNWKLTPSLQPLNDNFISGVSLGGLQGNTSGSNINATKESGEPNHAGNAGGKSVWWTWTPEKSGTTSVNTQGSSFDTLLAVYTGTDPGNLSLIAANDNEGTSLTSAVSFNAVAGTPYHIAVDGSNGAMGNVILNWNETPSPAPSNDNFVNAVTLTGTSGQAVGSNINATRETNEPNHIYKSVSTSVWWSWTAGKNGTLSVDTHGSSFDTVLTVFTGSDVAHLTQIAGNDDDGYSNYSSGLSFEALAGKTYYFAVSGYENRIGSVVLNWRQSGIILKSVSSTTGVSGQPLSIDINGSGFSSATQLWIGKDGGFTEYPVTYKNSALLSATLTITIPGLYSIKVSEGAESATLADALTISDPDASKLIKNKAIIVNGRGPGGDISAMTRKCSEAAYQSLKWQGFTDNDIFFLTYETESEGRDADPDYRNLKAVFDYLISNPPYNLIVYLVGHGDKGIFWLNTSEKISASDLNKWLDTVQKGMAGTLAFVYDACFSGSFIPYLKSTDSADGKSRIVITSSQADENSAFDDNGFSSFSYHFWTSVWSGDTLKDAFYHAKNKMENYQTPLLDADRDGIPGETQDYTLAAIYIGRKAPVNPNIPVISNYSASLQGNSVLIRANIDRSVQAVWAIIIPPDYSYDPAANNSLPIIPMNPSGYLQFEKTYSPLDKKGTYIVGIYAEDASGNNAVPKYVAVTQTVGSESSEPDIYDQHIPSDNLPGNALPILPNDVAQSHNFHAAGDQDWVKFYGVANTSYKITAGSPGIICNPVIRLYAAANTSTPIASSDSGLAGEPESLSWRCTQSGAYYVMVKNADGNVFGENARYALSLIIAEGPPEFWIQMYVRNVGSGQGIADATIQSSELDISISPGMPDYPYLGDGLYQFKAAGQTGSDFGMNVSSGNYIPFSSSSSYTIENSRMVKSISIGMIPTDLSGVITVLRILSGISPVLPGFSQEVGGDISGDGKAGVEEVVYILQKVAEMR
jgi:sugar lactone lactonase YvrE